MSNSKFGISGQALYLPPFKVNLKDWCEWTDNPWDKVRKIVGTGFRLPGPREDAYTMAANAVLTLITRYDISPNRIGYLALGTESSTDNAVGAVIVKGLVNVGLQALDLPPLPRSCEVPEFKQACLGGVYALKGALRYLAFDGEGKEAIVVSSDLASYQLGSTGEQTQGAGAVAQWVTANPTLLEVNLPAAGSASAYRGLDFRKPVKRYLTDRYRPTPHHLHDFPVFNGKFSTNCFIDEVHQALTHMGTRLGVELLDYLNSTAAIFAHRPYQRMPETALGLTYLMHLAQTPNHPPRLRELAKLAGISFEEVITEVHTTPDLSCFSNADAVEHAPYPLLMKLLRAFRDTTEHQRVVTQKTGLGQEYIKEFGNLYSAALPAWIGAGLEAAFNEKRELGKEAVLALGYGSGDAAEAIPMRVAPNWREAAAKLNTSEALQHSRCLNREEYLALHAGTPFDSLNEPVPGFNITHTGRGEQSNVDDTGIDYYEFIPLRS